MCCNQEGRLKTKFGPLSLFSFIKNLLGLSAKIRFVGWSTLLVRKIILRARRSRELSSNNINLENEELFEVFLKEYINKTKTTVI